MAEAAGADSGVCWCRTVYGFAVTKTWLVATFSTVLSLVGAIVIQNVSASSGRR